MHTSLYKGMPPKTRSTTSATQGKQTTPVTMAAIGDTELAALAAGAKESNDPNRLLLLNILANQKSADEKLEKRFCNLDTLVQASKQTLDKYIEDNDRTIDSVKGNVTTNSNEIQTLHS